MHAVTSEWQDEGAASDDGVRLRRAFDAHFDFIWRSARRLGLTDSEADDATQSAFIVAARKLDSIELGKERAFLFGTVVRVVADVRKGAARRYETTGEVPDRADLAPAPDEALDAARSRAILDDVVQRLPMDLRTVFVLFELEGATMAEIATLLEIPPGTVASRLRRAREQFEVSMERYRKRGGAA